jgi:hypothetical protein
MLIYKSPLLLFAFFPRAAESHVLPQVLEPVQLGLSVVVRVRFIPESFPVLLDDQGEGKSAVKGAAKGFLILASASAIAIAIAIARLRLRWRLRPRLRDYDCDGDCDRDCDCGPRRRVFNAIAIARLRLRDCDRDYAIAFAIAIARLRLRDCDCAIAHPFFTHKNYEDFFLSRFFQKEELPVR